MTSRAFERHLADSRAAFAPKSSPSCFMVQSAHSSPYPALRTHTHSPFGVDFVEQRYFVEPLIRPLDNPAQARRADKRIGQYPAGSARKGADDGEFD